MGKTIDSAPQNICDSPKDLIHRTSRKDGRHRISTSAVAPFPTCSCLALPASTDGHRASIFKRFNFDCMVARCTAPVKHFCTLNREICRMSTNVLSGYPDFVVIIPQKRALRETAARVVILYRSAFLPRRKKRCGSSKIKTMPNTMPTIVCRAEKPLAAASWNSLVTR